MKRFKVSRNVIRRLPRYLRKLIELEEIGITRISSADLGRQMGITPSQIRQDLSSFGEFGLQGYGYNVKELINQIGSILGADNGYRAVLVGAGKIGRALLSNFSFSDCGINLQCAFDINCVGLDGEVEGIPVLHPDELPDYIEEYAIDVAVLAVPKQAAKPVADMLVHYGIRAIWNFTNVELDVPEHVVVESLHFSDSLYTLSYYLTEEKDLRNEYELRMLPAANVG